MMESSLQGMLENKLQGLTSIINFDGVTVSWGVSHMEVIYKLCASLGDYFLTLYQGSDLEQLSIIIAVTCNTDQFKM